MWVFLIFVENLKSMLELKLENETSPLRSVVLGEAFSSGPIPAIEDAYDPKSLEHLIAGTYPSDEDMVAEMTGFKNVLEKYGVTVYRPRLIENYNQIFSRDIAFVIGDKFIKANILPDRDGELAAINYVIDQIDPSCVVTAPEDVHFEGGDVMLWNDYIFVGSYRGDDYSKYITARTNQKGVHFIQDLFPDKKVVSFDLIKSNTDPRANALHLDCCFQPVGVDKAIIYKGGFRDEREYDFLVNLFGEANLFQITKEEMYQMFPNVFSISPEVVVSERNFVRLNDWLRSKGFTVEEIKYNEIGKQGGLLRCSTLPLIRA